MLRSAGNLLATSLRLSSQLSASSSSSAAVAASSTRGFKAVADVEIDFNNRETFKKYIGIRDHLSREPGTRGKFMEAIAELVAAVKTLPEKSDYRKAVESTCAYRLKVCQQNESDAAVEEVLDAHLEELIHECKEEMRLIPIIASKLRKRVLR